MIKRRCEAKNNGGIRCDRYAKWWIPTWYGPSLMAACEKCAPQHGARDWQRRRKEIGAPIKW